MKFRLRLKRTLLRRAARKSPEAFRRELILSVEDRTPFGKAIQSWQQEDFAAVDPAWRKLAGHDVASAYRRAYIERPRGHSKTSDMAVQIAWILMFSQNRVQGLAAAADRDQAALLRDALERIARLNPALCATLVFRRHAVLDETTGSKLEIISSDVQSSWGALPDFVICDELCHWEKPDLWYSLLSSAAKRRDCVLAVLTNAGVGRGWQWEVREAARTSPTWYFSSLDGSQAPWIAPDWLDEQKRLLPGPVYQRLWRNVWQHSDGEFVTLAEAEACRDDNLAIRSHGEPGTHYIAAVDYAEKHDYTVGVVIHRDGDRIVVDRMDVVTPASGSPVPVMWVEDWMRTTAEQFHDVTFVLDEYQLLGIIQKLETEFDIHRFEFLAGKGNHALAVTLRRMIVQREIAWYPGCGQLRDVSERDDLETELASLILRQSASGRCRIDHLQDGLHHDDRAFALGAACLQAVQEPHAGEWMQVTPPQTAGNFAW